ncbi:hypothetical protein V1478_007694 [Vespula squamosa]|uniref:Uncharacterized protein n=1 Tax=Vespula squamosa TaxID=30214 RepID=A0ABD2AWN4_VESSQ
MQFCDTIPNKKIAHRIDCLYAQLKISTSASQLTRLVIAATSFYQSYRVYSLYETLNVVVDIT